VPHLAFASIEQCSTVSHAHAHIHVHNTEFELNMAGVWLHTYPQIDVSAAAAVAVSVPVFVSVLVSVPVPVSVSARCNFQWAGFPMWPQGRILAGWVFNKKSSPGSISFLSNVRWYRRSAAPAAVMPKVD